jgi:asparagine synthase (glutamine-hydrolysing)
MCGIAGYYNASITEDTVNHVIAALRHRGPDDERWYKHYNVGLIHTRLSVLELSSLGSQPYRYQHLVLVFNGELYNYQQVRGELQKLGYAFASNSDTEVLIKAFHCWGEACIQKLIGMFAFSVYNEQTNELFLFRDRVGVKPLYYYFQNGTLFFASELRALSLFGILKEINPDAVSLYFRFGFVPHSLSIYTSVSKLQPGHFLKLSNGKCRIERYWSPYQEIDYSRKEDGWIEELETLLISAFRYRMVSDVPVGIFLSGGVDSTLLAAILQKYHGGIHSFTIGFREQAFDESAYARMVAEHLNTTHIQKQLKLEEARVLLQDFYNIYDEPFADTSGIPTACVTKLAKESGMKVVLSADGGDELFGGYTHYQQTLRLYNRFSFMPVAVRRGLAKVSKTFLPSIVKKRSTWLNLGHKTYAFEELMEAQSPLDFFESTLANQTKVELINMLGSAKLTSMHFSPDGLLPVEAMMAWDYQYYLPDDLLVKVDRATMFHSLECREPFLDHRLVELSNRIPVALKFKDGKGKYLLRKLLTRYVPTRFFERKKQGFSIPIFDWFRTDLDALFDQHLSEVKLNEVALFNVAEIRREHEKYLYYKSRNKQYNIEKMWRILSFMLWWDKHMSNAR